MSVGPAVPGALPAAAPVSDAAFARLMAPLGPWPAPGGASPVAVAVSGGADSLCLAFLAARWAAARGARLLALVVDHRLRPEASGEAEATCARLHRLGIQAIRLELDGLSHGPGLAERARAARYAALTTACRAAGAVDLLIGHHAGDQAETVLMRARASSGSDGLAGMAALVETADLRLLRPLLPIGPERLRATLAAGGIGWIEDPSNRDPRAGRTRVRSELAGAPDRSDALLAKRAQAARSRQERRHGEASTLAAMTTLRPEGFAILPPALVPAGPFGALIRSVGGRPYRPGAGSTAALLQDPRPATLAGARLARAGRLGPGWILLREAASIAPPCPAEIGASWDGRFLLCGGALPSGLWIGATGAVTGARRAALRRRSALPWSVIETMPSLWTADRILVAVPHLLWSVPDSGLEQARFAFRPAAPATDAALFMLD